ncbi:MAG: hypothetical protein RSB34_06850, partial [Muribaculaceae bacterium]
GGVQRLRRRSWLVRDLPHNCVRGAHYIMGLNFRTGVLKWNVFDVLACGGGARTSETFWACVGFFIGFTECHGLFWWGGGNLKKDGSKYV